MFDDSEGLKTSLRGIKKLNDDTNELTNKILISNDPNELEDLTKMFKANQLKRDIARANKLSNLLDMIDNEAVARFYASPESFDNDQLLKYMSTTQQMIKNTTDAAPEQLPSIQINNQVNINTEDSLSRESRKRILDAVKKIVDSSVIEEE